MQELGHELRMQRHAAGVANQTEAAKFVNAYLDVASVSSSGRRPVNAKKISNYELGNGAQSDSDKWNEPSPRREYVFPCRVPFWLAEACDTVFGSDGYLVDMHHWAVWLAGAQENVPPRAIGPVGLGLRADDIGRVVRGGFEEASGESAALLDEHERRLRELVPGWTTASETWIPAAGLRDRSLFVNDMNEFVDGSLTGPGEIIISGWTLRNVGEVPWRDRLLYRIGAGGPTRVHAPAFVPVPFTDPGETVTIRVPIRAPNRPGTYRVCFKIGWPDGVFCHPTTLVGLVATVVVPPVYLRARWRDSAPPAVHGHASDALFGGERLGALLREARRETGFSQRELAEILTERGDRVVTHQELSHLERGARKSPLVAWHTLAGELAARSPDSVKAERFRDALAPISEPVAPSTLWDAGARRRYFNDLVAGLAADPPTRWYEPLSRKYRLCYYTDLAELHRRLAAGSNPHPSMAQAGDEWQALGDTDPVQVRLTGRQGTVVALRLRNTGHVPWRDRLLWRLGAGVTSLLPMTPSLLVLPDTAPGEDCEILVPLRGASLVGVADVNFVMVYSDLVPCFPEDDRALRIRVRTDVTSGSQWTRAVPSRLLDLLRGR
jgi:hypothetical protein